jgi:sarcosine oxidase subunit beta
MVAEDEPELERLGGRAAEVRALGFVHEEIVDRTELRRLVPAVADHCVGALVVRNDGAADPFRTVTAFRRKAESLGVRFAEGAAAGRITREKGAWRVETADGGRHAAAVLVNCAGAWADRVAAMIGDRVAVTPIAPMLMITARLPPMIRPVVISLRRILSLKQLRNGTVLIGGGHRGRALPDENRTELDLHKLATNAGVVADLFPGLRRATIVRSWAAIEALMPDEIPVIGPSAVAEGAFHAFGFSAHGFQLGPIVGSVIADLVVRGGANLPIAPFRIDRFADQV